MITTKKDVGEKDENVDNMEIELGGDYKKNPIARAFPGCWTRHESEDIFNNKNGRE
tara:strand:- start:746 stop:913 length:168 start_codon:yes stop_codon:yes gene_type:complete